MKWLSFPLLLLLMAVPCSGKSPEGRDTNMAIGISPGQLSATPEMWFYQQAMRRYQDPRWVVRQKAEFRSAERARRLAALKWFGYSNSRPLAGGDPLHGSYGPYWASGNIYQPFRWSGPQAAATIVVAASRTSNRTE